MKTLKKARFAALRSPHAPSDNPPAKIVKPTIWPTALRAGLACLLATPVLSASPVSYGFDALTNGALVGQDGWYADAAQSPVTSTAIATGTGIDTTQVVTSGTTNSDRAIRNFGTSFFSGTETKAVFQLDYRVGTAWTGGQFALAGTSNPNLVLNGNNTAAFSPKVTAVTNSTGTGMTFSLYPKSGAGWGTATSRTLTFSPSTISVGDWLQIQVNMDFTTGVGALYYKNLTLGQTAFTTLFWNASLGLNGSSSSPNQWNQGWMRIDKPSGTPQFAALDNLCIVGNGAGSEDFQGELGTRTLTVYDYSSGSPVLRYLSFPNFVQLLANQSAQGLQFNEAYIPNINNTADFASIVTDPLDPNNRCVKLTNFARPGTTSCRNELHYSTPYATDSQPNGTPYTFALRFYYTQASGACTLMQGYSEFPWLRIVNYSGALYLDLARSTSSDPATATPDLLSNASLGTCKSGSWNTLVVQVIHSNDPATGRIEVFLNGNKMTTFIGRTTFLVGSTKIPWLKAGPYSNAEATVWYDDVHWQPGLVYPYSEPGFEDNGVYKLEPLCALGKSLNVYGAGTSNGTNVIIADDGGGVSHNRWTAQLQADGSFELIPNNAPLKRLDVAGSGGSGANVQIWDDATQLNQHWKTEWQADGSFELIPQHNTGVRLDVNGGGNANGTNVQVLTDNNSTAQHWRVLRKQ